MPVALKLEVGIAPDALEIPYKKLNVQDLLSKISMSLIYMFLSLFISHACHPVRNHDNWQSWVGGGWLRSYKSWEELDFGRVIYVEDFGKKAQLLIAIYLEDRPTV